jgi:hypothetical protein
MTCTSTPSGTLSNLMMGQLLQFRLVISVSRFVERPARGLHDATLDLVFDAVGADGVAAVHRSDGEDHADLAGIGVHRDFDSNGAIGLDGFVHYKAEAAAVLTSVKWL